MLDMLFDLALWIVLRWWIWLTIVVSGVRGTLAIENEEMVVYVKCILG